MVLLRERGAVSNENRQPPQEHEFKLAESLSRTKRNIKDTILCNDFALFCTFTFNKLKVSDRTNYPVLRKQLSQHFNNYQKRHDKFFKYMFIPEMHKDGSIHFHGVCSYIKDLTCPPTILKRMDDGTLKSVPNTKHYLNWDYYSNRFGFFSCSLIREQSKCATYVAKYLTKDLLTWSNKGGRIVFKSHGLKKPELVYDGNEMSLGFLKPTDCDSEWCKAAFASEEYTARFYRHWTYPCDADIIQPQDWWRYEKWRPYLLDNNGLTPMTICDQQSMNNLLNT